MLGMLALLAALAALVGWVWILLSAFAENVLFAFAIFFISPLAVVFGLMHWEEMKVPTLLYIVGVLGYLIFNYAF